MKNLFFIFSFMLCVIFSANAQPPKSKNRNQKRWIDDSLLWVKQPTQIRNKTNNQASGFKTSKPSKVKQTKLDDLKNPFDTGNKIKPARKTKNYIGETEKN